MKRYFIEEAKCGVTEGGIACGPVGGDVLAAVRFNTGEGAQWITIVDTCGIPNVFLTDNDVSDSILEEDMENEEFIEYMNEHSINELDGIGFDGDYSCLFENIAGDPENPAVPLIRYLVALVRCETGEEENLISMAEGRYADELDIPASDVEEDYLGEAEMEDLYRRRLSLETDVSKESVFHDLDADAYEEEKADLEEIKACFESDALYESWKALFIACEYEKLKGKEFITCTYLFAGFGQYETTIPSEQKEAFLCWINGNGSAFYGGDRPATEEEIKEYIALHAADE